MALVAEGTKPQSIGPLAPLAKTVTCASDKINAERRAGRALVSKWLGEAVKVARSSFEAVAQRLQVHRSTVQHWANHENELDVTLGDLLVMPRGVAKPVLEAALAHVEGKALPSALSREQLLILLGKDFGEVCAVFTAALADGKVTRPEALRMLRELQDVISDAQQLQTHVSSILKEVA